MQPTVTVIQDWPAVLSRDIAARYLSVSESQLIKIAREPGSPIRPLNLIPGGDTMYSRQNLDEYVAWRVRVGYEQKKSA